MTATTIWFLNDNGTQLLTDKDSYTHNWSLQPFSQEYDLVFYITYVVYVNFIHEWQDLQFKVDSELRLTFSCQLYLLSDFLPEICGKEVAKKIFSYSRSDV